MQKITRVLSISVIVILIVLERVLEMNSFVKQGYKIVFLVVIPLLIVYLIQKTSFTEEYNFKNVKWGDLKFPLYVGLFIFFLAIVGYFILKPIVPAETLVGGLQSLGITKENIIPSVLYISFINSFIEEFFFRGFLFYEFKGISLKAGYLVSSFLFSLYHVLVMFTIFNWIMGILAMIGLMVVGMTLVYVNRSNKSIINSWIVHIFADLGVCIIGIYWFYMM